jgi:3-isopropylmalate/(R)-2-methylmalate dehydratase small subunit
MMEKFSRVTGIAAPLMRPNVDTDLIIPIDDCVSVPRAEQGRCAFRAWRYLADGSDNPDFILNRAPFRDAVILLAGINFGCGSSREPAVWALMGLGLRAIIAPSFGDIFYNNCFQNGVLPIMLPEETVQSIAAEVAATPDAPLTVDLENRVITNARGLQIPFSIDDARRSALLEGLDEVGLTLKREAKIAAWQDSDRTRRPWVYV